MNTITDPSKLEWNNSPLPSANLCHPNSRIIVWNVVNNGEYVDTAILMPHPKVDNYWIDVKGFVYAPSKYKVSTLIWAWYRRF